MRLQLIIILLFTITTETYASGGGAAGGSSTSSSAGSSNDSLDSSEFHELIEEAKEDSKKDLKIENEDVPTKDKSEDKDG